MSNELAEPGISFKSMAYDDLELNMIEAEGRDLPSVATADESAEGCTMSCCCCCSC